MQRDLDARNLPVQVVILGVCEAGEGARNAETTDGRDLPWLQDTPLVDAWGSWQVQQRDLVIVDADNLEVDRINLTGFDLYDRANYDSLAGQLVDLATP